MPAKSIKASRFVALLLALAGTVSVLVGHICDLDRRYELITLDRRFARFSSAPQSGDVAHVDIDDASLDEIGRWPWPRAHLAGIVDLLYQAGAESVALDIIMPEPQERRFDAPASEIYSGRDGPTVGDQKPREVFDDKQLREVVLARPNVFLPMHIRPGTEQLTPLEAKTAEAISGGQASLAEVAERLLPNLDRRIRTEDYEEIRRAYLRIRGLAALGRFAVPSGKVGGCPILSGRITPSVVTLAQACDGSGFVTFDPDIDGVVRRIPMLAGDEENVYPQFALSLAAGILSRGHGRCDFIGSADHVTVSCPDGTYRRIPIDDEGKMLINWYQPLSREDHSVHIPARTIAGIWQLRKSLERNDIRRRLLHYEVLSMAKAWPTKQAQERYYTLAGLDSQLNESYSRRIDAQIKRERDLVFDHESALPVDKALQEQEQRIEQQIDVLCEQFLDEWRQDDFLEKFLAKPDKPDADKLGEYGLNRERARMLIGQIDKARASNAAINRQLVAEIDSLRDRISGKLCLIGSVATGAADFVPTPVHERMPGVWVHANILNTIVSGAFIREAPLAVSVLVILVTGMSVGLVSATRPVLQAGPVFLLLAVGYAAINSVVVFARMSIWLPLVAPVAAMLTAFLLVTAYRQLTEEREKRRIRAMFAHAYSPQLVDQLTENPSLAKLGGERRELTLFFSDLQGFTALAERLGEEEMVKLLNRYFDRMTEVVRDRHGGYLNKFLGDGLFVFFGAPIQQDDHAARSLRAALACQSEVAKLNEALARENGSQANLAVRVGIATGDVMVGNCGSSSRMDYTAIGDAVNLASRLESANKFFGTKVLVDDETWRQDGGERYLARSFGPVKVVGKDEPVKVWHVICSADQADEKTTAARDCFAGAIGKFAERDFAEAAKAFEALLSKTPEDQAAKIFLSASQEFTWNRPGDDWDGALELTAK